MSHNRNLARPARVAGLIALLTAATPAPAVMLGKLEPLSALERPFLARITYRNAPDEQIESSCIRVLAARPELRGEVPVLPGLQASVEATASGGSILLKSTESPAEPILRLSVFVQCGRAGGVARQYLLLLEPPERFDAAEAARLSATVPEIASRPAAQSTRQARNMAPSMTATASALAAFPAPGSRRGAPTPELQADRGPPRREPESALADSGSGSEDRACCRGLSYELTAREGPPATEAEREQLRREFRERMAEGDMLARLIARGDKVQALDRRIAGLLDENRAAKSLREGEMQSERYAWISLLILCAGAFSFAARFWAKRARLARDVKGSPQVVDTPAADAGSEGINASDGPAVILRPVKRPALRPAKRLAADPTMPKLISGPILARAARGDARRSFVEAQPVPAPPAAPRALAPSIRPGPNAANQITFDLALPEEKTPAKSADGPRAGAVPARGSSEADRADSRESELFPLFEIGIYPNGQTLPAGRPSMLAEADADPALAAARALEYHDAYNAERFPELAAGGIVLDRSDTVIEGARIMYQEDLDAFRAIALLQLARSQHPAHEGPWLALFEIYWLEGMKVEFVDLARRFKDAFTNAHRQWPMIAKLGRDLDARNVLFRSDGLPEVADTEPNWLNAHLDMMSHVLVCELRTHLLESGGLPAPQMAA